MKLEMEFCPICQTPLIMDGKKVRDMCGLAIHINTSLGGWGRAYCTINFSEEVCDECFEAVKEKYLPLLQVFKERKGINKPNITVDKAHKMRDDKPSPDGYIRKILQLLPFVS